MNCDSDGLPFDVAGRMMIVNPFIHIGELALLHGGSTRILELFNPRAMPSNMSFCELQIVADGASPPTVTDLPNLSIPAGGAYTSCNDGETCRIALVAAHRLLQVRVHGAAVDRFDDAQFGHGRQLWGLSSHGAPARATFMRCASP